MSEYVILTDSSADLDDALVKALGVEVVPLKFIINGETYSNYPDNREMEPVAGTQRPAALMGLAFSSGLSATSQAFKLAAEELREEYPERKLFVVDTLAASMGQGLLVYHTAMKQKAGATIEEARDFAEDNKLHLDHWFTVDDLMYLKRGGRVSAATAVLGTMLSIKPVLHVDDEGHLINVSKARGRKASLAARGELVGVMAIDPASQTMFISHSDCLEDAKYVAELIREKYGTTDFRFNYIGPVIGAHTGPGCVALFFLGEHR